MNNSLISSKIKRLAIYSLYVGLSAAIMSFLGLFFFADFTLGALGIGFGISVLVLLIGLAILWSAATTWATEITQDTGNIVTAASAMAVGNFSAGFRTNLESEIGQIECALAQVLHVQKSLTADIDSFVKRCAKGEISEKIDDKLYVGEYKNLIKNLNSLVENYTNSMDDLTKAMKDMLEGNTKIGSSFGRKSEAAIALDELSKKFETMKRELNDAKTAEERAKKETEHAKEEAERTRRESSILREEVSAAKREASAAASDANNARREASAAQREAERLTRLNAAASLRTAAPLSANALPRASAPARTAAPARASLLKNPGSAALPSHDSAPVGSMRTGKIVFPSGAHEYDRKDYGKY